MSLSILVALAATCCACAAGDVAAPAPAPAHAHDADDFNFQVTEEQYYQFPRLFHLDDYEECLSQRGGFYCVGSFNLAPTEHDNQLFQVMKRYSVNWVERFNHTRLHRGLCVPRRCPAAAPALHRHGMEARFEVCVNDSTVQELNMTAQLYKLDYCRGRGAGLAAAARSHSADRVFAGVVAALLAAAALSTALDIMLSEHGKKGMEWALSWSVRGCWRALTAGGADAGPPAAVGDLRVCDGLRAFSMLCVVIEHVCWISCTTYQVNPRFAETTRRDTEALLLSNSTLLVQVFFLLSSFFLAHKLLQQSKRGPLPNSTIFTTFLNRIIRISPCYWLVVGFAATWWPRLGSGPLWAPLVEAEAEVCRRKWWAQIFYLNNIISPDDKCLIQTWYLAADMQLYLAALLLTVALQRWRRAALPVLAALFALSVAAHFALAYLWHLYPTFVIHNPEAVRATYAGDASFNWLYQSALGNLPGCLAGLLLAHLHHALLDNDVQLKDYKMVSWLTMAGAPLAALWVGASALLAGGARPARASAALLAALERPVFAALVAAALLGAFHNVHTPWRTWLSWRGWRVCARLSFAVLLLHMLLNKALVAARLQPTQLTHINVIYEWASICALSYLAALPLALLAELPAVRLQRALCAARPPAAAAAKADRAKGGS